MSPDELIYYRERAIIERRRASETSDKTASGAHLELAKLYEGLVESKQKPGPHLHVVDVAD